MQASDFKPLTKIQESVSAQTLSLTRISQIWTLITTSKSLVLIIRLSRAFNRKCAVLMYTFRPTDHGLAGRQVPLPVRSRCVRPPVGADSAGAAASRSTQRDVASASDYPHCAFKSQCARLCESRRLWQDAQHGDASALAADSPHLLAVQSPGLEWLVSTLARGAHEVRNPLASSIGRFPHASARLDNGVHTSWARHGQWQCAEDGSEETRGKARIGTVFWWIRCRRTLRGRDTCGGHEARLRASYPAVTSGHDVAEGGDYARVEESARSNFFNVVAGRTVCNCREDRGLKQHKLVDYSNV
ncbi:hypothetical protein B0H15DRAFT_804759 [Mycena belliarum]|uniref:Uncharacterized protein n=1 Tax=Mycena belliarum TaxID=1033014 RepID=A0AAD6TTI7_9AGAR|nr:hypothetical protein B0H15DRAFT_804759 [Mycena belliae]